MELIPLIWKSLLWFTVFAIITLVVSYVMYKVRKKKGLPTKVLEGADSTDMDLKKPPGFGKIGESSDKKKKTHEKSGASRKSTHEREKESRDGDREHRSSRDRENRSRSDHKHSSRDHDHRSSRDRDREDRRSSRDYDMDRDHRESSRDKARDRDRDRRMRERERAERERREKERARRDRDRDYERDKRKVQEASKKKKRLPSRHSRIQILNKLTNADESEVKIPRIRTSRNPSKFRDKKIADDFYDAYDDEDDE